MRAALKDPRRRVLFLLDEADAFLSADARQDFRILNDIKALMDATERRFKVVFAGLHNVRRFSTIPNQPLAHMGQPVAVGPLAPRDARDLVRRPMEALGFRFSDGSVVLKVLTLTNHHPALLQTFCSYLVDHLRKRGVVPPYEVTPSDVDAVQRAKGLQQAIRDRFLLTLHLDTHYEVLVRAMVLDQMDERDGFARSYSLQELRKLSSGWWPQGFQGLSSEAFYDYLDELCVLWILVGTGREGYRLRSPNVVQLLGTRDDIEDGLSQCMEKPSPDLWASSDLLHPKLPTLPPLHSPLSLGQLRTFGLDSTGVTMVFGSDATGLDRMPDTLQAVLALRGAGRFLHQRLSTPSGHPFVEHQLRDLVQRATGYDEAVVYVTLKGDPSRMAAAVKAILEFCHERGRAVSPWLHVVLLVSPDALPNWMGVPLPQREELEGAARSMALARFADEAVDRFLEEHGLPHLSDAEKAVPEATGGYFLLLERFVNTYVSPGVDPLAQAERLRQDLLTPDSPLAKDFRAALGLSASSFFGDVFQQLCQIVPADKTEAETDLVPLLANGLRSREETVHGALVALHRLALLERGDGKLRVVPVARAVLARR